MEILFTIILPLAVVGIVLVINDSVVLKSKRPARGNRIKKTVSPNLFWGPLLITILVVFIYNTRSESIGLTNNLVPPVEVEENGQDEGKLRDRLDKAIEEQTQTAEVQINYQEMTTLVSTNQNEDWEAAQHLDLWYENGILYTLFDPQKAVVNNLKDRPHRIIGGKEFILVRKAKSRAI